MRTALRALLFLGLTVPLASSLWALEVPRPQRLEAPRAFSLSSLLPKRAADRSTPQGLIPLPFGSIRPKGYLAEQMRLDANGLAGHLGRMFSDVNEHSGWLGGGGEGWERGPYYARGLVALACATGDPVMRAQAKPWVDWALSSQRPDGSFGPLTNSDWWPRMIVEQYLTWWAEATGDPRVEPFLERALAYQERMARDLPLKEWARFRGGDNLEPLLWLRERTGKNPYPGLARSIVTQTYDWGALFRAKETLTGGSFIEHRHAVNLAQGLKFPALAARLQGGHGLQDSLDGVQFLDARYGQAFGVFTGHETVDEPTGRAGTELCVTVEYLHSLLVLLALSGDPSLGDRVEKAAFNALPASTMSDHRGYQYYIQPNEVECRLGPHGFPTDHGTNLTFGAISGYPCCAVNGHYAWPLLSQRLFYATPDGGLAAVVYAPCELRTLVEGRAVTFREETLYPFRGRVQLTYHSPATLSFPLRLRIPNGCPQARVTVNGQEQGRPANGTFHVLQRSWKEGDRVTLEMELPVRVTQRENHSVALERGPLVFSLAIQEKWRPIRPAPELSGKTAAAFPSFEVLPRSDWNLALSLEGPDPFQVVERTVKSAQPFSPEGAPVVLLAKAKKVPEWRLNEWGVAGVPPFPARTEGPARPVTLLPFGCTRLRVTYLPVVGR